MDNAFEISGLVKRFPGFELGPIDMTLAPGTVLGYVGPNGSGKTTTMHCMMSLLRFDAGDVKIFGANSDLDHPHWKYNVGYVGDKTPFYEGWNSRRNLEFLSGFYPNWSNALARELTSRFELPLDVPVRQLSTGNRVKLCLVAAMAYSPRLLLFDEPTSGLDPVVRAEVLDVLFEVVESGERAIFYSTHILSDISRLADELAFIHDGKILRRALKDDLTDSYRRVSFRLGRNDLALRGVVDHRHINDEHQVVTSNHKDTLAHLQELGAQSINENRMTIDEIAVQVLKEGKRTPQITEEK